MRHLKCIVAVPPRTIAADKDLVIRQRFKLSQGLFLALPWRQVAHLLQHGKPNIVWLEQIETIEAHPVGLISHEQPSEMSLRIDRLPTALPQFTEVQERRAGHILVEFDLRRQKRIDQAL